MTAGTYLRVMVGGALYGTGGPSIDEAVWTPAKLTDAPRPSGSEYVTYESLGVTNLRDAITAAGSKILTLPVGVFEFSDFSQNSSSTTTGYGLLINGSGQTPTCTGIVGSGRGTILRMTAGSSTKTAPTTGTNGLTLIVFNHITGVEFGNLTLQGTDQGHAYNGARVNYCDSSTIHHVYFQGCWPGTSNSPPGENFGFNAYISNNVTVSDCELDGRNLSSTYTCSTALGVNSSANLVVSRTYAHHLYTGFGLAMWSSTGLTTYDFWTQHCGTGTGGLAGCAVNHEASNGQIRHYRPNWQLEGYYSGVVGHSTSKFAHFTLWNANADMTDVEIHDPTYDTFGGNGMFGVDMNTGYTYSGNSQKVTTPPRVYQGGVQLSGVTMPKWWQAPSADASNNFYISTGSLWG